MKSSIGNFFYDRDELINEQLNELPDFSNPPEPFYKRQQEIISKTLQLSSNSNPDFKYLYNLFVELIFSDVQLLDLEVIEKYFSRENWFRDKRWLGKKTTKEFDNALMALGLSNKATLIVNEFCDYKFRILPLQLGVPQYFTTLEGLKELYKNDDFGLIAWKVNKVVIDNLESEAMEISMFINNLLTK